jgi:hypothetical protein
MPGRALPAVAHGHLEDGSADRLFLLRLLLFLLLRLFFFFLLSSSTTMTMLVPPEPRLGQHQGEFGMC